ncbi:uncharacterized protein LOC105689198 [Athalia rosae]|uniref:uncharacterized protein LOC105689198 n=1 Tax=Athalia rosae TaxID=37344 RepID=UPI0020336369|nr:uncharacterized protein LOC105689198 [Athalia rosae]
MNREISPRRRRKLLNSEISTDIKNGDQEMEKNVKYTSTPIKKIHAVPDSEESTDAPIKPDLERRNRSVKSIKNERKFNVQRSDSADNRERRQKIRSKRRRSEGNKNYLAGNEGSQRVRKERNLQREGEDVELPITELLRKAQENQRRYDEPIALPELTTDTLYVQGKRGFSAVKIKNYQKQEKLYNRGETRPIDIAIRMHSLSKTIMFFCQGLLGGIALNQLILVLKTNNESNLIEEINATNYADIMSGIFMFLATICILAAMDRIDLARLDLEQLREVICHRCMTIITLPLYLVAAFIHLSSMNGDHHQMTTKRFEGNETSIYNQVPRKEMITWECVLCIVAWLCIALGPSDDMTATHLEDMQKYAD